MTTRAVEVASLCANWNKSTGWLGPSSANRERGRHRVGYVEDTSSTTQGCASSSLSDEVPTCARGEVIDARAGAGVATVPGTSACVSSQSQIPGSAQLARRWLLRLAPKRIRIYDRDRDRDGQQVDARRRNGVGRFSSQRRPQRVAISPRAAVAAARHFDAVSSTTSSATS